MIAEVETDSFLSSVIISAGEHLGGVIRLLCDGVAFRRDGKTFEVYSHEGDELGTITTADLSFAINFMRRQGREVGKCKHYAFDAAARKFSTDFTPAFTFAWIGYIGY